MEKLKLGQIVYINNQKYSVVNMIEFDESGWKWQQVRRKRRKESRLAHRQKKRRKPSENKSALQQRVRELLKTEPIIPSD